MVLSSWRKTPKAWTRVRSGGLRILMKQEQFLHVLTKEEAEAVFHQHISMAPSGEECVPLAHGLGRVLSRDIVATVDVPYFNRSNVDGFAVVAADTFGVDEESPTEL